jgi:homeobox-leucine zipper protein
MDASGKYVRYTNEQVEALERVYHECPKPSSIRRAQLIKESPILANIEPKQIKVWFQNRRYEMLSISKAGRCGVFGCGWEQSCGSPVGGVQCVCLMQGLAL